MAKSIGDIFKDIFSKALEPLKKAFTYPPPPPPPPPNPNPDPFSAFRPKKPPPPPPAPPNPTPVRWTRNVTSNVQGFNSVVGDPKAREKFINQIDTSRDLTGFSDRLKAFGARTVGAMSDPSEIKGFGKQMEAFGSLTKGMGPAGDFFDAFGRMGKAVTESVSLFQQLNNQLHTNNMRFADWSVEMASVKAEQTFRDIQLSQVRGDRRADSARVLAEGKSELDKRIAFFEDKIGSIWAWIAGKGAGYLAKIIDIITFKIFKDEAEGDKEGMDMAEWMTEMAKKPWDQDWGRPPRMP